MVPVGERMADQMALASACFASGLRITLGFLPGTTVTPVAEGALYCAGGGAGLGVEPRGLGTDHAGGGGAVPPGAG